MKHLVAIDPDALADLASEVRALREAVARLEAPAHGLTIAQAAAQLGVSVSTVYRRIKAGEVKATGRGKMRRVFL